MKKKITYILLIIVLLLSFISMSRNGNAAVRVVAEYNDFGDDGTIEWGDNYIYYLHMDEIYKDTKETNY